jgi:hypothetical protein
MTDPIVEIISVLAGRQNKPFYYRGDICHGFILITGISKFCPLCF